MNVYIVISAASSSSLLALDCACCTLALLPFPYFLCVFLPYALYEYIILVFLSHPTQTFFLFISAFSDLLIQADHLWFFLFIYIPHFITYFATCYFPPTLISEDRTLLSSSFVVHVLLLYITLAICFALWNMVKNFSLFTLSVMKITVYYSILSVNVDCLVCNVYYGTDNDEVSKLNKFKRTFEPT